MANYQLTIVNLSAQTEGRKYFVFSEHPYIEGNAVQKNIIYRTVCQASDSLSHQGEHRTKWTPGLFGFIGQLHMKSSDQEEDDKDDSVKIPDEITVMNAVPITIGSLKNDGSRLRATLNPTGIKALENAKNAKSKTFIIECVADEKGKQVSPQTGNYVVGVARRFDGEMTPLAAIKYQHGSTYTITPKDALFVSCGERDRLQIVSDELDSQSFRFTFSKDLTRIRIAEDRNGGFINKSSPTPASGDAGTTYAGPSGAPHLAPQTTSYFSGTNTGLASNEKEIAAHIQQEAYRYIEDFNRTELSSWYTDPELRQIASQAEGWYKAIQKIEEVKLEIIDYLLLLALYDCVLLLGEREIYVYDVVGPGLTTAVDDSTSVRRDEGGLRYQEMKEVSKKIVDVNTIFNRPKGVLVEFLNHPRNVRVFKPEEFEAKFSQLRFRGLTKLGTVLHDKILDPLVYKVSTGKRKPLLILIITDGRPEGEEEWALKEELRKCKRHLAEKGVLGNKAVVFQIAQVGNDVEARKFLRVLDTDKDLKGIIDVTSNEKIELVVGGSGKTKLAKEMRTIKMLAGALDVSFDQYHQEGWDAVAEAIAEVEAEAEAS